MNHLSALFAVVVCMLASPPSVARAQSPESYHLEFPDVVAQLGSQTGDAKIVAGVFPSKPAWCKRVTIDWDEGGQGPTAIENPSALPRPAGTWNVGCGVSFRHGAQNGVFDGLGFEYPYAYAQVPAFDGLADCQGTSSLWWNVNGLHHMTRSYSASSSDPYERWAFDGFSRFDRGGLHWLWITARPDVGTWSNGHWIKSGNVTFKFPGGFTVTYWPN